MTDTVLPGLLSIMGLLSLGTPLSWEEASKFADHVRNEGVKQFINAYKKGQSYNSAYWSWGDEIEYVLVQMDESSGKATLSLRAEQVILKMKENEVGLESIWHPEYAKFMLESTPAQPYSRAFRSFLLVEENMKQRRVDVLKELLPTERVLSMANFPLLGTVNGVSLPEQVSNESSRSCFLPDEVINSHARFKTLTRNIRTRRGQKVDITLPLFLDEKTDPAISSKLPCLFPHEAVSTSYLEPKNVYMDCMAFGMGCCCLQLTMQTADMDEARYLYDQFAILAPILLTLTAASPIFRGLLVDTDCRWSVIEASVDDRTREERGLDPLLNSKYRIEKSRYASASRFLSAHSSNLPEYNDLSTAINETVYQDLRSAGVDDQLASHIAHLFIRDPLVVFRELLQQDNTSSSDHFENIQSTNWQTVRFKPPSLTNSELGWRVEFRPMEVQLSDFENAAFTVFSVLIARAILHFRLSLYLPLSLVELNIKHAQKRNAVLEEKFFFRTNITSPSKSCQVSLLSAAELVCGKSGIFEGLASVVRRYLTDMSVESEVRTKLEDYICFVERRATGEACTPAKFIRDFVLTHPQYSKDSIVSEEINYDLIRRLVEYK